MDSGINLRGSINKVSYVFYVLNFLLMSHVRHGLAFDSLDQSFIFHSWILRLYSLLIEYCRVCLRLLNLLLNVAYLGSGYGGAGDIVGILYRSRDVD